MDPVDDQWQWVGLFRPLLHIVDQVMPPMVHHGRWVWFAQCGALVVRLQVDTPDNYQRCPDCQRLSG